MVAKPNALRVLFAAFRAGRQCQRRPAAVAEFPRTSRLAADGAYYRFSFQLAAPNGSRFSRFLNVAAHGFSPALCHRHFLAGRTVGAEHVVLVVAGITHPTMAAMATVEVLLRLVFGSLKSLFMLLLPFGAHTVEAV